jgi:hypothetical protein
MTPIRFLSTAWPVLFATAIAGPAVSLAQTATPPQAQTAKPKPKPAAAKPAAAKPAATKPAVTKPAAAKPAAAKPAAAKKPATPPAQPAPATGDVQPTLLGKYGEWGAYSATPEGKKICFALAKPGSSQTNPPNRPRDPANLFVSTRPAEKVKDEVSVIIGYSFKPNSEATLGIGSTTFAMYTQNDGAWIKNAADEAKMVEALRKGSDVVIKGTSGKGTQTTDTFTLKGLAQAIDRIDQECK